MEVDDSVASEYQHMDDENFKDHLKTRFSNPIYPKPRNPIPDVTTCADPDSDVYNFDHPHRGLAIIINNENFHSGHENRTGSHHDETSLTESLGHLGFHVEVFRDLKDKQMLLVAKTAASLYGHQDADCFVFAILTHGDEVLKTRQDGSIGKVHVLFDVEGSAIETEKIVTCFNDNSCPSLIGKPRLFFIQACRGVGLDDGVKVKMLENGQVQCCSPPVTGPTPETNNDKVPSFRVLLYPDSLIMYASPSGFLAWRRKTEGSWFIQELCKFLKDEIVESISFARGLTTVCRRVAEYESSTGSTKTSGKKCIPVVETQLLNDIYMRKHSKHS